MSSLRNICSNVIIAVVLWAVPVEARTLAAIKTDGTLKVGFTGDYAPYSLRGADGKIAGADVTTSIRQTRIDKMVPVVARHPQVRQVMRTRQRELAEQGDAVMEGRDIGTVVCPSADVKVYLTAEPGVRAARRQSERPDVGADALATDLRLRDERDAERMRPADDAVEIDTTDLSAGHVVDKIEELVRARQAA